MRVLATGAHPDDLLFTCAGTLALFMKRGDEVFMCHACDGDKSSMDKTSKEIAAIRRKEEGDICRVASTSLVFLYLLRINTTYSGSPN